MYQTNYSEYLLISAIIGIFFVYILTMAKFITIEFKSLIALILFRTLGWIMAIALVLGFIYVVFLPDIQRIEFVI